MILKDCVMSVITGKKMYLPNPMVTIRSLIRVGVGIIVGGGTKFEIKCKCT